MSLNSFSLKERLKKNDAIKAVLDGGACYKARLVNIYILEGPDSTVNRAAFICKKALHQKKSVLRNRIRRIIREAYRKTKHLFLPGHDIVIIGTRINQATKSLDIERDITDVFKKHDKK